MTDRITRHNIETRHASELAGHFRALGTRADGVSMDDMGSQRVMPVICRDVFYFDDLVIVACGWASVFPQDVLVEIMDSDISEQYRLSGEVYDCFLSGMLVGAEKTKKEIKEKMGL